jgi:hypothetical protein
MSRHNSSASASRIATAAAAPVLKRGRAGESAASAPALAAPKGTLNSPGALGAALFPDWLLTILINFFTSLRLTVVLLALGLVLVFFGTMAQDPLGLYLSQEKFFHSFSVSAPAMMAAIKKTLQILHIYLTPATAADVRFGSNLPVFPGGYLIGGLLLINLVAAHFQRLTFTRGKAGIWLVHFGLILLLVGQLATDLVSRETTLHLREGETRNYSEAERQAELAVINTSQPDADKVVAIPQGILRRQKEIRHPELPFVIRVKDFFPNSLVEKRESDAAAPPAATQGIGPNATVKLLPPVTEMERRDVPSGVIEVVTPEGRSLGTWLVSEFVDQPQVFSYDGNTFQLALRPRRFYKPYSLQLLNFQHEIYPGTDIPRNFSSRVKLQRPDTGENRDVDIHMNSPLRYAGETYYQAGFDPDDHGTILQVVHNPSWLTPYFSCILVGAGLVCQFATHLFGFTFKRRTS